MFCVPCQYRLSANIGCIAGATSAGWTNWLQDTANNIKASETQAVYWDAV